MKYALALSATCLLLTSAAFAQTPTPTAVAPAKSSAAPTREELLVKVKEGKDKMFKKLDANGDGTVTKAESDAFSAARFAEQDLNKDGKVTKEEWDALQEKRNKEFISAPIGAAAEPAKK